MSTQDNNLSAFPVLEYEIDLHHQSYEAGWLGDVAKTAYQLADEMLEARKSS